jgi:small-conductance mechanosensitive channel
VIRSKLVAALAAATVLAIGIAPAWGQTAAPTGNQPAAPDASAAVPAAAPDDGVPLRYNHRTIAILRGPFLGAGPKARVAAATKRLDDALSRGGPDEVTTRAIAEGNVVLVGGQLVFGLTPVDVNAVAGETLESVTADAERRLRQVIEETREARNLRALAIAAGQFALGTLLLAAVLWALRRARRMASSRLLRAAAARAERLEAVSAEVLSRERALRIVRAAVAGIYWLVVAVLVYEWLGFTLTRFPQTRAWGEQLTEFLVDVGTRLGGGILGAIPNLVVAIAIFFIARSVVGVLKTFFDRVQGGQIEVAWLDADNARPTRRLVVILVWIFAFVMAYPYLPGSDSDAFKGVSVLVGLMISLGASSIVAQGASGLILMYTRTLRPGEYVRIGDHEGTVVELGMFMTRLRTGLGEELTLPSSLVLGAATRNYSRAVKGEGFVLDTAVTIGYDAPWRQVHAMLAEAARRTEGVLADPVPKVFQTALSDFYVEYRLVCQAVPSEPRPRAIVMTALHQNIQDVFNEYGVQIMSPHYLGDPDQAKVVPKSKWHEPPAAPPAAGA